MSDAMYPMHLVDLKAGFISRTLAGSLNSLFFDKPTMTQTAVIHTAVTVITFLLVAIFLGACIKKADEKSGRQLFLLSLITAVLPYGFMTFVNLFELLDIYWVLAAVLCLLCAEDKKAVFLFPVFIILGGWAHYSFVLAFMPVIYILFFYRCLKEKSRLNYIITGAMIVISVSSTIYFSRFFYSFNCNLRICSSIN